MEASHPARHPPHQDNLVQMSHSFPTFQESQLLPLSKPSCTRVRHDRLDRMIRLRPPSLFRSFFSLPAGSSSSGSTGPRFDVCPDAGYQGYSAPISLPRSQSTRRNAGFTLAVERLLSTTHWGLELQTKIPHRSKPLVPPNGGAGSWTELKRDSIINLTNKVGITSLPYLGGGSK